MKRKLRLDPAAAGRITASTSRTDPATGHWAFGRPETPGKKHQFLRVKLIFEGSDGRESISGRGGYLSVRSFSDLDLGTAMSVGSAHGSRPRAGRNKAEGKGNVQGFSLQYDEQTRNK